MHATAEVWQLRGAVLAAALALCAVREAAWLPRLVATLLIHTQKRARTDPVNTHQPLQPSAAISMAAVAQPLTVEVSSPLERQQVLFVAEAAGLASSVQVTDASQLRLAVPGAQEITTRNAILRQIVQSSQRAADLLGGDKAADAQACAPGSAARASQQASR